MGIKTSALVTRVMMTWFSVLAALVAAPAWRRRDGAAPARPPPLV